MTSRLAWYPLTVIQTLEPLRNEEGDASVGAVHVDAAGLGRGVAAECAETSGGSVQDPLPGAARVRAGHEATEAEGGTPLGVWAGRVLGDRQVIERPARRATAAAGGLVHGDRLVGEKVGREEAPQGPPTPLDPARHGPSRISRDRSRDQVVHGMLAPTCQRQRRGGPTAYGPNRKSRPRGARHDEQPPEPTHNRRRSGPSGMPVSTMPHTITGRPCASICAAERSASSWRRWAASTVSFRPRCPRATQRTPQ